MNIQELKAQQDEEDNRGSQRKSSVRQFRKVRVTAEDNTDL